MAEDEEDDHLWAEQEDSRATDEDESGGDDDAPFWEEATSSRVFGVLSTAKFDAERGVVTLEDEFWDPKGGYEQEFRSIDSLRHALIEIGDAEMDAHVPWENGPVFETDSDDIVDASLDASGIADFFESLDAPPNAELLLTLDDICQPEKLRDARLSIEEVNDFLIAYLAERPELMRDIHPRRFEEVVAELFRRMGYEVVLTPPARDGGRDVQAVRRDDVGTLLTLVECKRYSSERPVGVGLVRSLYGVVAAENASHGVIATTSSFTRGARQFQQNLAYRLSLDDFDNLTEWCRRYRRAR